MSTERTQINLRVDPQLRALIDQMRRDEDPIPSVSELIRQALIEKAERRDAGKRGARR